jgi:hypothetical protein
MNTNNLVTIILMVIGLIVWVLYEMIDLPILIPITCNVLQLTWCYKIKYYG